jgi:hypothetical protein
VLIKYEVDNFRQPDAPNKSCARKQLRPWGQRSPQPSLNGKIAPLSSVLMRSGLQDKLNILGCHQTCKSW